MPDGQERVAAFVDELRPDELPSPDGDTFWHPDFYDELVVSRAEGKEAQRRANALGHDTTEVAVMPNKRTLKLAEYLRSCGWQRSDEPAAFVGECGASSDTVGYCEKSARWSKGGSGWMCAQHAAQAQRYIEHFGQPRLP